MPRFFLCVFFFGTPFGTFYGPNPTTFSRNFTEACFEVSPIPGEPDCHVNVAGTF